MYIRLWVYTYLYVSRAYYVCMTVCTYAFIYLGTCVCNYKFVSMYYICINYRPLAPQAFRSVVLQHYTQKTTFFCLFSLPPHIHSFCVTVSKMLHLSA